MLHFIYHSARHKSFTFFSAANPAIPFGGMLDESKAELDQIIPARYRPITRIYEHAQELDDQLRSTGLSYPIIIKPDIGLKGHHVHKVNTKAEALSHLGSLDHSRKWLLQEYIDYQREFALLFARDPLCQSGQVLSLIEKRYPTVLGDGRQTLKHLILEHPHPFLRKEIVLKKWKSRWAWIPENGKMVRIDDVGNYSRGATFHSEMHTVDPDFVQQCCGALQDFDGLYFYRMDLKANCVEDIAKGAFKVIEVNGAKSEPLHIYDQDRSFWQNAVDIKYHWTVLSSISATVRQQDHTYVLPSFSDGIEAARSVKRMLAS